MLNFIKILFFLYSVFIYSIEIEKNKNIIPFQKFNFEQNWNQNNSIKYRSNTQEHDIEKGKSYLNGNVLIEYFDTKIEADRVEFNWKTGDIYAIEKKGNLIIKKNGNIYSTSSKFHINLYNKKLNIKNVFIKEKDHVIIANKIKKEADYSFMKKIIYTSDPLFIKKKDIYPDFYLKIKYLKFFNKKKFIITGPVSFFLYKVPMPIIFPFIYIPIKNHKNNIFSYGVTYPKIGFENKKIYVKNIGFFSSIYNYFNFFISNDIDNKKCKLKTEIEYQLKNTNHGGSIHLNHQYFFNQKINDELKWIHNYNNNFLSYQIEFHSDMNSFKKINIFNFNIKNQLYDFFLLDMNTFFLKKNKEIQLKIPKFYCSIQKKPFLNSKNIFFHPLILNYQFFFYNPNDEFFYEVKKNCKNKINNYFSMETSFPFFTYLKIVPKINYKGIYPLDESFHYYQTIDQSTNFIFSSIIGYLNKINFFSLKHQIDPIFSLNFKKDFSFNRNLLEKKINFIINNYLSVKKNNKKIKILNFFQINTSFFIKKNYLKWEKIYFIGNTDFTKNFGINYEGYFSKFYLEKIINPINYNFNFSLFYNLKNEINFFNKKNQYKKKGENRYEYFLFDKNNYAQYSIPIHSKFEIYSNYEKFFNKKQSLNTFFSLNTSINLTKYWNIEVYTDYDLIKHKIIYTNFHFYRDLRSFQMNFYWTPIGKNRFFSFFIGIKDPNLNQIFHFSKMNHY
ncbi:putative LPS assembly protein LptD [Blattabacterium cuenoti]|uniref:putative LPS assembly protein LptD n=1 Tax=Blattabacterium cuenoti TaxID=1653831 RepID=UPI001EEC18D2|nr:putative LPS assembly protein LptD [Blattabacterium cuenoti]